MNLQQSSLALVSSFGRLHSWVDDSYKIHNYEHNQFLFFVFLHVVGFLIRNVSEKDILRNFVHRYRFRFIGKEKKQDLNMLEFQSLNELVHIKVESKRTYSLQIVLSASFYDALTNEFFSRDQTIMKTLIKDKVRVQTPFDKRINEKNRINYYSDQPTFILEKSKSRKHAALEKKLISKNTDDFYIRQSSTNYMRKNKA